MNAASLSALVSLMVFTSCTPTSRVTESSRSRELAAESAAAFIARDDVSAQKLAAEATRLDPEFAEAWVTYGMASIRLGQAERAREAYERALSLHETRHREHPAGSNHVAQQIFLLALLDRTAEAEALLQRARADYPNDPQVTRLAEHFAGAKDDWKELVVTTK